MWKSPWNPMLWLDRGRFSSQPDAPRPLVVQAAICPKIPDDGHTGEDGKEKIFHGHFRRGRRTHPNEASQGQVGGSLSGGYSKGSQNLAADGKAIA